MHGGSTAARALWSGYMGVGRMTTRRCVVSLAFIAGLAASLLIAGCARFDGVVDFEADPRSGRRPLTVQFTPLVSGEIKRWIWNFGDGTVSTERSPEHTYTNGGSYRVSLTVFPRRGEPTTASKDSYITVTSGLGATPIGPQLYCSGRVPVTDYFQTPHGLLIPAEVLTA